MKDPKAIQSTVITLLLILLIESNPVWGRISGVMGNLFFYLVIFILGLALVVTVFQEFRHFFAQRKNHTHRSFYPLIISLLALIYLLAAPKVLNLDERLYGNIVLAGYCKGTQTQAIYTFRDNGKLVVHRTGVFFASNYTTGKYTHRSDTFFIPNSQELDYALNDTLIARQSGFWRVKGNSVHEPIIQVLPFKQPDRPGSLYPSVP